jgi:hypothetical protein
MRKRYFIISKKQTMEIPLTDAPRLDELDFVMKILAVNCDILISFLDNYTND